MRLEDARRTVTSVRPTKNGKWEVVQTTKAQDAAWEDDWRRWWKEHGETLQREHPHWWDTGDMLGLKKSAGLTH